MKGRIVKFGEDREVDNEEVPVIVIISTETPIVLDMTTSELKMIPLTAITN